MFITRSSRSRRSVAKCRLGLEPLEPRHLLCAVLAPLNFDSLSPGALPRQEPSLLPAPKTTALVSSPLSAAALVAPAFQSDPTARVKLFLDFDGHSEASWGSLRYLLAIPVPRARLLAVKLVVSLLYSALAMVLLVGTALLAGTLRYGWNPLRRPIADQLDPGPGAYQMRGDRSGLGQTRLERLARAGARPDQHETRVLRRLRLELAHGQGVGLGAAAPVEQARVVATAGDEDPQRRRRLAPALGQRRHRLLELLTGALAPGPVLGLVLLDLRTGEDLLTLAPAGEEGDEVSASWGIRALD